MSLKILLADDHKIVRDGLRFLLEKRADMEVVADAENGREAVKLAREKKPDVVIMDINMPDLNGIEASRQIIAALPQVKVIALSMHRDRRFIAGMFKAGASAFLLKTCAFDELVHAINEVVVNRTYLSPSVAEIVIGDMRLSATEFSATSVLTAREREILQLLAEGRATRQIASHLHVSVKTVETHRRRIMEKLGLRSIAQLTKYAIREGLTSREP